MVMNLFDFDNPKKTARIAGLMYLGVIVFGILSQVIRMGFIVDGDAATTANNIMANEMLFLGTNVLWLISEMFLLWLGLALYILLKPVNKNLATLMMLFVAVGVAIESINTLNLIDTVQLLSGADYLAAFSTEQLNAQVMFHLHSWEAGYSIAAIMSFGPWLIPLGYLFYESGYIPRIIGIIAILAGIGILIEGFQALLLPGLEVISLPAGVVAAIGEFAICGWLLVIGVQTSKMKS